MTSVNIEVRWYAEYREDRPTLWVQFKPLFEGLSQSANDSLHSTEFRNPFPPEIAGDLHTLAGLAAEISDTKAPLVEGRGWQVRPKTLERTVTATYFSNEPPYWLYFDFHLVHPVGLEDERKQYWQKSDTKPEMHSIVARIDEYAMSVAHAAWATRYNQFAKNEAVQRFLPGPATIFLSYRAARPEVVKFAANVHDDLSGAEESSFFQVFLDRPDLRSGEWKPQLASRIRESDVFVPILTDDYEEGETALWECEEALGCYDTSKHPLIIPLLAEGRWDAHGRLSAFNGAFLPLQSDAGLFKDQIGRLRTLIVDAVSQRRR